MTNKDCCSFNLGGSRFFVQKPDKWSKYPAIQDVDLDCNELKNVKAVNFCNDSFIGPDEEYPDSLLIKSQQNVIVEPDNYMDVKSTISADAFLSLHQFQGFPEDTVSITNDTLVLGGFKWTGGVLAPNGKIYGIPSTANSVLIYDPKTKEVDTTIEVMSGNSKWSGGVLAPNNKIYCVPDSLANRNILVIDPKSNTTELYPFVKNGRWAGGVLAPNGKIYCVPSQGDLSNNNLMSVLVIDPTPTSPVISFIDTSLDLGDGNDDELFGGVLAPNGKIYCIPRLCSKILVIDTNTNPVTTYTLLKPTAGTSQWCFGALGGDGCVYGCPRRASSVLKIDPFGDVVSVVGAFTEVTNGFFGAVLAPNNKIYFPTLNGTNYLEFDVETAMSALKPLPGSLTSTTGRFFGGVLTPYNEVMFIPANQDAIVEVKTGLPKINDWMLQAYFNKL